VRKDNPRMRVLGITLLLSLVCLMGLYDMIQRENVNPVGLIFTLGGLVLAFLTYWTTKDAD